MDLQAEIRCKAEMLEDPRKFLLLFDDSFSGLYRYVARRVSDETVREQIVQLVYADAVGQMGTCPTDVGFATWLYGLARQRVYEYVQKSVVGPAAIESPIFDGASVADGVYDDELQLKQQADTFFSALTLEEREIVKLKFFEELMDGEVMYVLGLSEGVIGTKIYKVLKRGYEILFGEVSGESEVYYGELHSFLARLKGIEKIPVPEGLRLNLRVEVEKKLEKNHHESFAEASVGAESPAGADPYQAGSSDPAKAFVYAAKGMSKDEVDEVTEEYVREREVGKVASAPVDEVASEVADQLGQFERQVPVEELQGLEDVVGVSEEVPVHHVDDDELMDAMERFSVSEAFMEFWERWRSVVALIPAGIFIIAVVAVAGFWLMKGPSDEGVTGLKFAIDYGDGFEEAVAEGEDPSSVGDYELKALIERELIAKVADGKDVEEVKAWMDDSVLEMRFELVDDGGLEYVFEGKGGGYKVKSYKKTN